MAITAGYSSEWLGIAQAHTAWAMGAVVRVLVRSG